MVGRNKRKLLNLSATVWLTLSLPKARTALNWPLAALQLRAFSPYLRQQRDQHCGSTVNTPVNTHPAAQPLSWDTWPEQDAAQGAPRLSSWQKQDSSTSRPSLLCSGRGDLPAPKVTQDTALTIQALAADSVLKWRRMSTTTDPVQPNSVDELELQFIVQNLVMVWVGGHTWEA